MYGMDYGKYQAPAHYEAGEGCLTTLIRIPVRIVVLVIVLPVRMVWDVLVVAARAADRILLRPWAGPCPGCSRRWWRPPRSGCTHGCSPRWAMRCGGWPRRSSYGRGSRSGGTCWCRRCGTGSWCRWCGCTRRYSPRSGTGWAGCTARCSSLPGGGSPPRSAGCSPPCSSGLWPPCGGTSWCRSRSPPPGWWSTWSYGRWPGRTANCSPRSATASPGCSNCWHVGSRLPGAGCGQRWSGWS